jgi:membrane protein implicated in regulation of membrane protease activity
MNFCPKCGYQLKPEASFCGNCGENIFPVQQNAFKQETPQAFSTSGLEFKMPNTQQRIVNLWLILMAVFTFIIFLPSIIGLDGMDGGFAMSFISGFMVITSIIVILVYRSRAKQLDKILSGEGRIAVWKYLPEEWMRFILVDFEAERKAKKFLFILVSVICVVVGVILMIAIRDVLVLFISLGIIPIVAVPAFLAPRMRYRKLQQSESKALIAENGVIVGKMFHLWVKMGARLDSVLIDMESDPKIIEFSYSIPTRNGRQEEVARVPIPKTKMDEAMRIVEHFNSRER